MIGCPQCGESSSVQIEEAGSHLAEPGSGPRWRGRCGDCGTDWTFSD